MLWIFGDEYASGLTHFTHLVVRFPGKVSDAVDTFKKYNF